MASHVVGPFLIASDPLDADDITTLDDTAEWTFTLLEVIPPLVTYPTDLEWRVRQSRAKPQRIPAPEAPR